MSEFLKENMLELYEPIDRVGFSNGHPGSSTDYEIQSEKSSTGFNEIKECDEDEVELENELYHETSDMIRMRPSQYSGIPSTVFIEYAADIGLNRNDTNELVAMKGKKLRCNYFWERHCLRNTFIRNSYSKSETSWTISWSNHLQPAELTKLTCIQKTNHFPSSWCIGRKDRLVRTLNEMSRQHRNEFNFHPDTFILPIDHEVLQRKLLDISTNTNTANDNNNNEKQTNNLWIVKPCASSCGRGIFVKTSDQISDYISTKSSQNKKLLVQKYLSNPYLINGNKFALRIYVLVTGVDPLRVYVFQEVSLYFYIFYQLLHSTYIV